MEYIYNLPAFLRVSLKASPAEWIASFLLLGSFAISMIQLIQSMKRIRISLKKTQPNAVYYLDASNIGMRNINIRSYGYRKWDGSDIEIEYRPSVRSTTLESETSEELYFFERYGFEKLSDPDEAYYFFVRDTSGKKYKLYTDSRPWCWAKAFMKSFSKA